jgi:hypothetical protein
LLLPLFIIGIINQLYMHIIVFSPSPAVAHINQHIELGINMKLRTDAIGHFDVPTEDNIRNALVCSEEA